MVLHCLRFGEIVMDSTFRTFILCNKCNSEFFEVPEFRVHIATGVCGEPYFRKNVMAFKFGAAASKRTKDSKQYFLYNPSAVSVTTNPTVPNRTAQAQPSVAVKDKNPLQDTECKTDSNDPYFDLLNLEEELMNPRWYTDTTTPHTTNAAPSSPLVASAASTNKPLKYKELVEEVGPYVQFKEQAQKPTKVSTPILSKKSQAPVKKTQIHTVAQNIVVKNQENSKLLNPTAKRLLTKPPQNLVNSNNKAIIAPSVPKMVTKKLMIEPVNSNKRNQQALKNSTSEVGTDSPPAKRRKTVNMQEHKDLRSNSQLGAKGANPLKMTVHQITPVSQATLQKKMVAPVVRQTATATVVSPLPVVRPAATAPKLPAQNLKNNTVQTRQVSSTLVASKTAAPLPSSTVHKNSAAATAAVATNHTKKLAPTLPAATMITPSKTPKVTSLAQAIKAPAAAQQTAAIIDKLQTMGLQVKRTIQVQKPTTAIANSNARTLDILKKLQSKGMNVKLVNGNQKTPTQAQNKAITFKSSSPIVPKLPVNQRKLQLNGAVNSDKNLSSTRILIKKV